MNRADRRKGKKYNKSTNAMEKAKSILGAYALSIANGEGDASTIKSVVLIIGDIVTEPPPFPLVGPLLGPNITIGDVKNVRGFYKDELIVYNLVNTFQGRQGRFVCQMAGIEPDCHTAMIILEPLLVPQHIQILRCIPHIIKQAVAKHGDVEIDTEAVAKLHKAIEQLHEQSAELVEAMLEQENLAVTETTTHHHRKDH